MAKRTPRRTTSGPPVDEVTRLDEKLTEVTSTAAATLKKYRYHIVAAVVVLILLVGGIASITWMRERSLTKENQALWNLVLSPEAQKDGPTLEALERLIEDARGTEVERYVLKSVGEYLAQRAVEDENEDVSSAAKISREDAYRKALELASEVRTRFPDDKEDDKDLQTWADGVEKKLKGEHDTSWLPSSPKYDLPAPPAPPAQSGTQGS